MRFGVLTFVTDEGIGPVEVLDRVAMQCFVGGNCTMIGAAV